jgi:putative salt-induced outer membrane protein
MKKILLSTALIATLALTSHAEDVTVTPLVTHTELGYIETNGNTSTKTFNLDTNAKKSWGKHQGKIALDGQYSEDSGTETKNKYIIELNYNYAFTDRLAFNYLAGYKADKFSSYDYQFYTGPGLEYKAIITEQHKLTLSGNILYAQDKSIDNSTNDYAAYRLKGVYDYQITKTLKFGQELSVRGQVDDMQNYFGYSKTSLSSKISDIFSAGVSYKADYVNQPIAGKDHTDTTLTLNLIMDY